ncbi:hypothetical protein Adt_03069 [Abeliophyllum distichum]|uniref:Uncharacterized protein n=1 Tax=Abeliophyllum distichum TaxID=126358 RepID=A0ABD1VXZ1_9LAMI
MTPLFHPFLHHQQFSRTLIHIPPLSSPPYCQLSTFKNFLLPLPPPTFAITPLTIFALYLPHLPDMLYPSPPSKTLRLGPLPAAFPSLLCVRDQDRNPNSQPLRQNPPPLRLLGTLTRIGNPTP